VVGHERGIEGQEWIKDRGRIAYKIQYGNPYRIPYRFRARL